MLEINHLPTVCAPTLNFKTMQNSYPQKPKLLDHIRLESGYDIRTMQELLDHKDVSTTMIYTHVLNKGTHGVHSPIYGL